MPFTPEMQAGILAQADRNAVYLAPPILQAIREWPAVRQQLAAAIQRYEVVASAALSQQTDPAARALILRRHTQARDALTFGEAWMTRLWASMEQGQWRVDQARYLRGQATDNDILAMALLQYPMGSGLGPAHVAAARDIALTLDTVFRQLAPSWNPASIATTPLPDRPALDRSGNPTAPPSVSPLPAASPPPAAVVSPSSGGARDAQDNSGLLILGAGALLLFLLRR